MGKPRFQTPAKIETMRGKRQQVNIIWAALASLLMLSAVACDKTFDDMPGNKGTAPVRDVTPEKAQVLVLYSAGFNSLCAALEDDVNDMKSGYLPLVGSMSKAVLVYSRRLSETGRYTDRTPSYLIRLSVDGWGKVISDTLKTWPETDEAVSASTMTDVLETVKGLYPYASYGMVFSSHGSGWLPSGYYSTGKITAGTAGLQAVPYIDPNSDGSMPRVKSIGIDNITSRNTYEMEIETFAQALPMKFDYIIIDACLMGGIEVAYALKDKCDKLVFSQAEVLEDGLCDYTTLTQRVLKPVAPDLYNLCEDSYQHYKNQDDPIYRSLTISMIDCTRLDGLAESCKSLFSKYRNQISLVNAANVQGYFRSRKHWFYDLTDILRQSGVPEADMTDYNKAMSDCVLYNAATDTFINFDIRTHCGLSMYLPADGNSELDEFYKTLSWNKASGLVL
uniref:clostripain-related cysteine peptidase n=1 Tax=Candidatus Cryptobacteroides bacterium TaxID=3085639 RepID=UPI004026444A